VPERWTHVERAAGLTLEKDIIAAQMNLGGFSGGAKLFQMAVAEFSLLIFLVAHSLGVGYPLRYRRGSGS
jgi:hypothetical protein